MNSGSSSIKERTGERGAEATELKQAQGAAGRKGIRVFPSSQADRPGRKAH
jgi:hypothetical protein